MMTTAMPVPVQAPGFNLGIGPAHGPSELVMFTHTPGSGEVRVAEATAQWMKARERLWQDPDANLDDLVGGSN